MAMETLTPLPPSGATGQRSPAMRWRLSHNMPGQPNTYERPPLESRCTSAHSHVWKMRDEVTAARARGDKNRALLMD